MVPDGNYQIEIRAEDGADNVAKDDSTTVAVGNTPPLISALSADPNPFSPNYDGTKDSSTIAYTLAQVCSDIELRIKGPDGALYRSIHQSGKDQGSFVWDGSDGSGHKADGSYKYCLVVKDAYGNISTSEDKSLVVEYSGPLIQSVAESPSVFSPVNPANNCTAIHYYLADDGVSVEVSVRGENDRIVKTIVNNEIQSAGGHTVYWYGDYDPSYDGPTASADHTKIADGTWIYKVIASAVDDPASCDQAGYVLVDNVPPYIICEPVVVDNVAKKATLTYSVPETAVVDITVCDSVGTVIRTLKASETQTAGVYTLNYDFTQDQGMGVGDKHFKIVAVNSAKNVAETTAGDMVF